ncbi:MAG: MFS transporter [Candidatus Hydrogenedentes bacterium]|nr:MFS transporter [Candidatus Hydrogenedentota bacterium]
MAERIAETGEQLTQVEATPSMARAWLVVGLLWMVALLNYLDRLTITTMRDSIVSDIPMTDAQFGLLTSVFLWIYAALSPAAGYLADRYSRSGVIVVSLFVWSAVTWLTGHCQTFGQLVTARALMGIGEACYIPAALALISDYHRGATRSKATGIHMSGIYAGSALGGIGGYLAVWYGWRTAFTAFGLFGVFYAVLLFFVLRDASKPAAKVPLAPEATAEDPASHLSFLSALSALLRQPSYLVILAHWSLLAMAGWSFSGWLPTYLKEHFNMGQGAAGISATAYLQVAAFVGILVGGAWADAWHKTNVRGRILVPCIGLLAAGPALFMTSSTNVFTFAVAGLLVYGLSRGFTDSNMMPILCQVADPRYRATGYGFMNFCSCSVGGVMIWAGGKLRDHDVNIGLVFQVSAVGLFLGGLMLLLIKPRRNIEAQ